MSNCEADKTDANPYSRIAFVALLVLLLFEGLRLLLVGDLVVPFELLTPGEFIRIAT